MGFRGKVDAGEGFEKSVQKRKEMQEKLKRRLEARRRGSG